MAGETWVWFDVDDVLVDTSREIERSLRRHTGVDLPVHLWQSHAFTDMYGIRPEGLAAMREAWERDQILERAELFPEAVEAMRVVSEKGHKVGLITARAWHPRGREITEAMARDAGMPVERVTLLRFEESKLDLLLKSGTEVAGFVDDTPRHVEGALSQGWHGRLVSRPWNRAAELPRVGSVLEFAHSLPESPRPAARMSMR